MYVNGSMRRYDIFSDLSSPLQLAHFQIKYWWTTTKHDGL